MRSLIVYESMYGNTHLVAEAIGKGLESLGPVNVVPVHEATQTKLEQADLVVVGGPTHAHGMSRESTRHGAVDAAHKPGSDVTLDPDAEGEGLREWFETLTHVGSAAAAFDTRFDMSATLTGRASKGISKRLRHHGFSEIAKPESFFVEKNNTLEEGEQARAIAWGQALGRLVATSQVS